MSSFICRTFSSSVQYSQATLHIFLNGHSATAKSIQPASEDLMAGHDENIESCKRYRTAVLMFWSTVVQLSTLRVIRRERLKYPIIGSCPFLLMTTDDLGKRCQLPQDVGDPLRVLI